VIGKGADKVVISAPARVVSTGQHAVDERAKAKVDPPPWGPASRIAPAAYDGTGDSGAVISASRQISETDI
jgi:hypothetical protein